MGYLVCEKCGGYYKLWWGESPEDFDSCTCGGDLYYVAFLDEILKEHKKANADKKFKQRIGEEKKLKSINKKSNQYYSNKKFIILLIAGFFLIIFFTGRSLIRSSYVFGSPITITIFAVIIILGLVLFLISGVTKKY